MSACMLVTGLSVEGGKRLLSRSWNFLANQAFLLGEEAKRRDFRSWEVIRTEIKL